MVSVSLANAIPTSHLYDEYRASQYRQYETERLRELLVDTIAGTLAFLSYFHVATSILFCKATALAYMWRHHKHARRILPQHRFLVFSTSFICVSMIRLFMRRRHRIGELYTKYRSAEHRFTSRLACYTHCAYSCHTQR